ncbi:MAG: AbgT family transporter [Gemmatimonadaceae bacterium]
MTAHRSWLLRSLDRVERAGNKLPDPITIFAILALTVVALSWLTARLGVSAIHPGTGAAVTPVDLATAEGVRRMLTEGVRNFTGFAPLGLVIVVVIGIGVTERSGLITAALRRLLLVVPPSLLTATVVFAGVMSSMAVDAGYVVLVPLGAVLFQAVGRHPLAGLAAALAGVSGGFSANLLITSLDPLLAGLTTQAAQLVDPAYNAQVTGNYFFMIASTFLVTVVGAIVTTRIVEPRLGPPPGGPVAAGDEMHPLTDAERRGLRNAGLVLLAGIGVMLALTVPEHAVLRNPEAAAERVIIQLRPFFDSLVMILMLLFLVMGIVYGRTTGSIRSDRDVAAMSSESVAVLGSYIVLAFAAAQFVAYFNWSNLGLILAIQGADGLKAVGFTGIPLLLAFIVVSAFINLFMGSASAKWAVMAPVFVPMLMLMGFAPEVTQGAYRIGDSTTNIIAPLMQYFPLIIAFAQKYQKDAGIGTVVAMMLPYSIALMLIWSAFFALWLLSGVPLGPGAPLIYPVP